MFVWYDYFILVIALLLSTLIGIYFGYFAKKPLTAKEYLSGGKRMKILPVAISVTVGHFSAIILVGAPADIYKYGAFHVLGSFSVILYVTASIFVYYPVLFKTKVSSIFEYLEKRFDRKTRLLSSFLYIIYETLMLSAVIYSPSLALSVVTGYSVHLISFLICGVCIFYTAIGGLRTVIWTDLLQFIIIMLSLFILCKIGITTTGGISEVWKRVVKGERLDIFDFDLDPTKKDSFWILVIGSTARHLYFQCLSQSSVQKYLSLPTQRDCTKAIIVFGLCFILVKVTANLFGLILYATYANCDPVLSHQITKNDQIVPYYVEQVSNFFPGISGLFITGIVSAGISTLSSSLNALSGVIYDDFISNLIKNDITEVTKVRILKSIVLLQGLLCTGFVVVVPYLGDILPMLIGTTGLIDGPSLGLLTLGIIFPQVNSNGAFYGTIGGLLFIASIYFPSRFYLFYKQLTFPSKPLSISGCIDFNLTISETFNFTKTLNETSKISQPNFIFRISYQYYCLIGAIVTIILGVVFDSIEKKYYNCTKQQMQQINSQNKNTEEVEMVPMLS